MTYKAGEVGKIVYFFGYIIRNGIYSVENPIDGWQPYMHLLNAAECETGYSMLNKKNLGEDYTDELYEWINSISLPLRRLKTNACSRSVVERLKTIKFINEKGIFAIIDGDKKTIIGRVLDYEFIDLISDALNEYIIPTIEEYRNMEDFSDFLFKSHKNKARYVLLVNKTETSPLLLNKILSFCK